MVICFFDECLIIDIILDSSKCNEVVKVIINFFVCVKFDESIFL